MDTSKFSSEAIAIHISSPMTQLCLTTEESKEEPKEEEPA